MSATDTPPPDAAAPNQTGADAVLRQLADEGFSNQLIPVEGSGGSLLCTGCRSTTVASAFAVEQERRLEGASNPDEMLLVVAATCPACGAGGSVALAYGPEASPADSDVVAVLPDTSGD